MNILIIGSGGREHALARQLYASPECGKLYVAPGNAGTATLAENIPVSVSDFEKIKKIALQKQIGMLVIGPEQPLVEGLYDFFENDEQLQDIMIIGPSKAGALLEGSKQRAKEFMAAHNIPTAGYKAFGKSELEEGRKFLEKLNPPYVLKADGLAAGKGVLILDDLQEAKMQLEQMLVEKKFGSASDVVVIEEFLDGIELSVFALTDGKDYKILPAAKDYKRIGNGDTGLNTGGMGAVSPVPFADKEFMDKVETRIVQPTIEGLYKEKITYKGFVFFGLINVKNEPYVIEYNVRMGDPESEVVLPRIKTDLLHVFKQLSLGKLDETELIIDERQAVTVMLVSGGYPEDYEKGKEITGLDKITDKDVIIYHAGTRPEEGKVWTNGGRVLAITALGTDFKEAMVIAYKNEQKINFDKKYCRSDIGKDLEAMA